MPVQKRLAALAIALTAAIVPSPSIASTANKVCLTNKAWVVWDGTLDIQIDVNRGLLMRYFHYEKKTFSLALGQSLCVDVVSDFHKAIKTTLNSRYGESAHMDSGDFTFRLDGSIFGATISVLKGVRLD